MTPAAVEAFLEARQAAGYTSYRSAKALVPLLGYLRGLGVAAPASDRVERTPVEELLERYRGYLTVERGLTPATAGGYVDAVRPFLAGWVTPDGLNLASLTAGDVTAFVVATCPGRARGPAKLMVTALRSLLGFGHVDGVLCVGLAAAVPSVAG